MYENTLAVYGCSHSTDHYGVPYGHFLAEKLGMNLHLRAASGGNVGNHLEKLNFDLQNEKIDVVLLQLSQYFRWTTGFRHFDDKNWQWEQDKTGNGARFKHIGMYTWRMRDEDFPIDSPLMDHFKPDYPVSGMHKFVTHEIVTSNWMRYQACYDLFVFSSLCKKFNKPLFVFSWDYPLNAKENNNFTYEDHGYLVPEWEHLLKDFGFIEQPVVNKGGFFTVKGFKTKEGDLTHYGTDANEALAIDFIYPKLISYVSNL